MALRTEVNVEHRPLLRSRFPVPSRARRAVRVGGPGSAVSVSFHLELAASEAADQGLRGAAAAVVPFLSALLMARHSRSCKRWCSMTPLGRQRLFAGPCAEDALAAELQSTAIPLIAAESVSLRCDQRPSPPAVFGRGHAGLFRPHR